MDVKESIVRIYGLFLIIIYGELTVSEPKSVIGDLRQQ